jgi:hypothetical protein
MRAAPPLMMIAMLLAGAVDAAAQDAQPLSLRLGGGGGVFVFLNGSSLGGVLQGTARKGPLGATASAWLSFPAGMAVGLDVGALFLFRETGSSAFVRAGPGHLWNRDLTGPGFHIGAGWLTSEGPGPGVRLEAICHRYVPGGGVPLLSLIVALTPGRE